MTTEEGMEFAQSKGLKYIETSAKTNENISEVFNDIAKRILKGIKDKVIDPANEVN